MRIPIDSLRRFGQSMVEVAILLPVLLLLASGVAEFGNVVNA
ncbi:MAG: TadE/TadG family type IV pilus assembly protein [Anaerolineae bacterium]